jgi:hypothetical protein
VVDRKAASSNPSTSQLEAKLSKASMPKPTLNNEVNRRQADIQRNVMDKPHPTISQAKHPLRITSGSSSSDGYFAADQRASKNTAAWSDEEIPTRQRRLNKAPTNHGPFLAEMSETDVEGDSEEDISSMSRAEDNLDNSESYADNTTNTEPVDLRPKINDGSHPITHCGSRLYTQWVGTFCKIIL